MQKIFSVLALLACSAATALAQVNVEVVFDQEQFLRSESVPLRVRISNFSGQTLRLGTEPDWLNFTVAGEDGKALARSGRVPLPKPFSLESAKTVSLTADLLPYYELSAAGHYKVSVQVRVPELAKEVAAKPQGFDIISGTKLWQKEVGVPGATPPVVRKYALQQATFLKQARLYVRVTDASEATVLRVILLGALTSFSTPETQVDRSSNLHVIFQNGQRSYSYSIITPDGEQIIRQSFDIVGRSRPRLRPEEDGRVTVLGGERRVALTDLPPPENSTNAVVRAQ